MLLFVGLLAIVGRPFAVGDLHAGEDSRERRILGTACIDAKADIACSLVEMAHAHLSENDAIVAAFNAEIVAASAQAIPHRLHGSRNLGSGPVGISMIGHHTAQMLEAFILVFHRTFQPIVAVEIQHDAALVKALMTVGKVGLDLEGEKLLVGGHLQHWGVVVAKVVVSALPQICMWRGGDADSVLGNLIALGVASPLQFVNVKIHIRFGSLCCHVDGADQG